MYRIFTMIPRPIADLTGHRRPHHSTVPQSNERALPPFPAVPHLPFADRPTVARGCGLRTRVKYARWGFSFLVDTARHFGPMILASTWKPQSDRLRLSNEQRALRTRAHGNTHVDWRPLRERFPAVVTGARADSATQRGLEGFAFKNIGFSSIWIFAARAEHERHAAARLRKEIFSFSLLVLEAKSIRLHTDRIEAFDAVAASPTCFSVSESLRALPLGKFEGLREAHN
ncbi:hypothetical protein ACLOJK_011343 [Asimina triloba]